MASAEIVVAFCVAHLAAGGQLPTPQWLLAAGGSVFLASWLVIRRRFRLRWMVPVLTVAQLWLHLTASAATAAAASPGHAGHAHLHGEQPVLTWSMLAAHVVAAGVTALIWAFRRRLWRVLRVRPPVVTTNPIAPRLSATQVEALDLFDSLANDPRLNMFTEFQPGDIQLVHNHTMLHDRTGFVDWPEPERRRHLLRLWLAAADARPLPEIFAQRYGTVTIGDRGGIVIRGTKLHAPLEAV